MTRLRMIVVVVIVAMKRRDAGAKRVSPEPLNVNEERRHKCDDSLHTG